MATPIRGSRAARLRRDKAAKLHGNVAGIPPSTGSVDAGPRVDVAAMRACIEEREDRMAQIAGQLREANRSFVETLTRIGVSGATAPSDNGSHPDSAAPNNLRLLESKTAEQIFDEAEASIQRQRRYLQSMKAGGEVDGEAKLEEKGADDETKPE